MKQDDHLSKFSYVQLIKKQLNVKPCLFLEFLRNSLTTTTTITHMALQFDEKTNIKGKYKAFGVNGMYY
mgnify:CR=1 FL=1